MSARYEGPVYLVLGPTASGKSDCAVSLARHLGGEIVNADSVQMYAAVSVGSAKPDDWQTSEVLHHLFDICTTPTDFDVVAYRALLGPLIDQIRARGRVPVLVGGSLFYSKSLFFPPAPHEVAPEFCKQAESLGDEHAWEELCRIDPDRAGVLHQHDTYRVKRALALWYATGIKPSKLVPAYDPLFEPATIVSINPPLPILYERINARTLSMMSAWIDEIRALDAEWRSFVTEKGFIGYPELVAWVENGEDAAALPAVIAAIQAQTRAYAKRQKTFWKSFARQLRAIAHSPIIIEAETALEGLEKALEYRRC